MLMWAEKCLGSAIYTPACRSHSSQWPLDGVKGPGGHQQPLRCRGDSQDKPSPALENTEVLTSTPRGSSQPCPVWVDKLLGYRTRRTIPTPGVGGKRV